MLDAWASRAPDEADPVDEVPGDVAAIVIRARELGFSPTRVAIALGVPPRALASIELVAAHRHPSRGAG